MAKARKNYNFDSCNDIFPSRLREQMKKGGKTQTDIAKAIGISRQSVSQYTDGSTQPSLDKFLQIAEYFNVSTDFLLGKVDAPTTDVPLQQFCEYTGLTENSANRLWGIKSASNYFTSVINQLLTHEEFIDLLSAIQTYKFYNGKSQQIEEGDNKLLSKYFGCKSADVAKYVEVSSKSVIEDLIIKIVSDIIVDTNSIDKHKHESITINEKTDFADSPQK